MIREVSALQGGKRVKEYVAEERELRLVVNGRALAAVKLSPQYEEEFALGYCFGEGLIKDPKAIKKIRIEGDTAHIEADAAFDASYERYISSDCISGWRTRIEEEEITVSSEKKVSEGEIVQGMKELQRRSGAWKKTGGLHSVGLVNGGAMLLVEDTSRHVAMDKAIGLALRRGLDLGDSYIHTTGRLPGDMVIKAARAGIPIIASRTAPIHSGIVCALRTNVTIIGFARGRRMNIYTHPWRVLP